MKSFKKFFLALAVIPLILLAFPGAAGQGEKVAVSKKLLAPAGAGALNREAVVAKAAALAVPFVENAGRFDKQVLFSADLFSGRFFLTGKELVYSLAQRSKKNNSRPGKGISFKEYFLDEKGARIAFQPAGEEKAQAQISYFRGNDPAKWQNGLASYNSVSLGDIYPGIRIKLRASGKNVEKMFYVNSGSDVALIRIGVAGVAGLRIADDGRLIFKNSLGELAMRAPVAWQEIAGRRQGVKAEYRLLGEDGYGFVIKGDYDKRHVLVIDPDLDTLVASTFLGGSVHDYSHALALDGSGNVYVTGQTNSFDFPVTSGVYDQTKNSDSYFPDAFVSKLNGDLTTLLASTYLNGSISSRGHSLALDGAGNVFVMGSTGSSDFPTTSGAFRREFNNVFIAKLNDDLTMLLASTFLGGNSDGNGFFLVLDKSGSVYVTGETYSDDFPTTEGAYDRSYNYSVIEERWDAFVCKFNNNLTSLLASTYLGGERDDLACFLALDAAGNVYVTGYTGSANFPTTPGAFSQARSAYGNAFVSKLDGNLTKLLASTLLGGNHPVGGRSLALDNGGNVYLLGGTSATDFPTTPGAYDRSFNGGTDFFVAALSGDLTTLRASTYLGGNDLEFDGSLVLDRAGNVYLAGSTTSPDFPVTPDAFDKVKTKNYCDGFISKLNGSLTELKASTFLGGSSYDYLYSLALDDAGNVCVTGTASHDFPTTPGGYSRTSNNVEVFVSKLNGCSGVSLDLQAERREARSFSVVRQYGQVQFDAVCGPLVAQYLLLRRQGNGDFIMLKAITPSELQDNRFQVQDKYLEKDVAYAYRVEAYDASGRLIAISSEKSI